MKRLFTILILLLSLNLYAQESPEATLMADDALGKVDIPLTGAWAPESGPSDTANFSDITNFRYTDNGLKMVDGYQRINYNTPVSSYPYIKSLYQYRSSGPTDYSILLAQADDGAGNSVVIQNNSTVPYSGTDAPFVSYAELITNGTFEGAGGWVSYGSPVTSEISTDYAHSGTKSYKVVANSGADGFSTISTSKFAIKSNVVYTLAFWIKSTIESINITIRDSSYNYAFTKNIDNTGTYIHYINDEWSYIEISFISSYELTAGTIYFESITTTGTAYFDDISLSADYLLELTTSLKGVFSKGPKESVLYSNGYNNYIWPGMEFAPAVVFTASNDVTTTMSNPRDWTEQIINEGSDPFNVAYVGFTDEAYISSKVLLHLDSNFTDTSTNALAITDEGDVTISNNVYKFGGGSATFDGAGDYLSIPDNVAWYAQNGFELDAWIYLTSADADFYIYVQDDGTNYVKIFYDISDSKFKLQIENSGDATIDIEYESGEWVPIVGQFFHFYFSSLSTLSPTKYFFINGESLGTTEISDTGAWPNLAAVLTLGGYAGCTDGIIGYIDEINISTGISVNKFKYADFQINEVPYDLTNSPKYLLIGAHYPFQAIKIMTVDVNDQGAEWVESIDISSNNGWQRIVALSDNSRNFVEDGWITVPATFLGYFKKKTINDLNLYWSKIELTSIVKQISSIRLYSPFQEIRNSWDQEYLPSAEAKVWNNAANTFYDYSDQVNSEVTTDVMDLSGLTSSDYVKVSFAQRVSGIKIYMPDDNINTTASTALSLYGWSGSAWQKVKNASDGTSSNSVSLAKTGVVTFEGFPKPQEHMYADDYGQLFYQYKLQWDKTLSASVKPYYIEGIPYIEDPPSSKFPLSFNNRAILCNLSDGPADILISGMNAPFIYNGKDSGRYRVGGASEEIVSGTAFTVRYDSELYDLALFHKKGETWRLVGTSPSDYKISRLSDKIGCVAPKTIDTIQISDGSTIAMWLSSQGVVMSDGSNISIMKGIERYFDKTKPETLLNFTYASNAVGFFDPDKYEYNIQFPRGSSTTNNTWLIYDISRAKWFKKDSPQYFRSATTIQDSTGAQYVYGGMSDGYVVRNEYGNAWVDPSMTSNCKACAITGNVKLNETSLGSMWNESRIKYMKVRGKNLPKRVNYDDDLSITEVDASSKLTIASSTDQTFSFTDAGGSAAAYAYSRPAGITTNYGYANWGEWAYTLKLNLSSVTTSDTAYVFGLCEDNTSNFLTNVDVSNKAGYGIKFLGTASGIYSLYFEHWSGGSAVQLGTNSITGLLQGTDYYIAIVKQKVNTVNVYGYDQYRLVGLVYTDRDMRNLVGSVSAMIDNSASVNTSLPYLYYFSGTVTSIGVVTNISEIDYLAGYFAVNGNNNWENIKPFGSKYNSETNYSIPKYEDVVRSINVFGGSHQIGFSVSRKWTLEAPELYKIGLMYDVERMDNQITEEN
jgi:hypothetical protein